ncbi:MAG: GIY-YIG nuclease family protein [Burkholderiales bacterium]|nr:GIY-YIG nuclease family protein [Burkholderiales bacterium]
MSQANHEPNHNSPQTERRIIPFPRRHLQRPDALIVSNPEAHLLPKVAAAGGGDDDGRDGRKRRRLRCVRNAPLPSAQPIYIIYQIRRLSDERSYVGVTQRGLETRFRFHRYDAQRRGKRLRAGGLAEAIRQTIERNVAIHEEFEITKIDGCSTPREARKLEQHWIERLQTRAPKGFNLQPGGASLGGPANGRPITLRIDGQRKRRFPSIMSALNYVNALRIRDGKSPLGFPTVRARIEAGHTPRQAFEFEERVDRRQLRAMPIHVAGKEFFSLANAAKESGLSQSALKGRRWRASRAGLGSASLAEDRRLPGSARQNGAKTGRLPPFELPHPHNANEVVSAADFARLTGLSKATITYRYQKILHEEGDQLFSLDREEIIARLLEGPERRIQISLPLPDGRILKGGVRELIRKVLADPDLRAMRSEDIGLSGIRKRLRETESWPTPPSPQIVAKAFGFGDADI